MTGKVLHSGDARLSRRNFLRAGGIVAASLPLGGCFDFVGDTDSKVRDVLAYANSLSYRAQRFLLNADALAREYESSDIRQPQRPNGSTNPQDGDYRRLAANDFSDWRLEVAGLVDSPLSLSLETLRAMPSRTQITRHDCVEGWSCIAQWTGVKLSDVLAKAGVQDRARFVVFDCFDSFGLSKYYESVDLADAYHPQTILAYGLNGEPLPVSNGAPLRVRIERQLGYKMAKYLRRITVTDTLAGFGGGKGGYWEDSTGYDWYAGI